MEAPLHLNRRRNQNSASFYHSSTSLSSTPGLVVLCNLDLNPPVLQYLRNLNIPKLRHAPLFVWKLMLEYASENQWKQPGWSSLRWCTLPRSRVRQQLLQPLSESRSTLGLCNWEVWTYPKACSCSKPRSRNASEHMVKHRAANLMCRDFLETFERELSMEMLPPVHAALKELRILKHNT